MPEALFVTVGGSPQPIITAIESLAPKRVVFICSGGKNSSVDQITGRDFPCRIFEEGALVKKLHNIPEHCKLGENFNNQKDIVIVEDMDDLGSCYSVILQKIIEVKNDGYTILTDYTGGTKTMSAALAMAALEEDCRLFLTTGIRKDLIKVSRGEHTEDVNTSEIHVEKIVRQIREVHLKRHDYSGAVLQLSELLRTKTLSKQSKQRIRTLIKYNRAFELWDRFSHRQAWELLEDSLDDPFVRPFALQLKRVIQSRRAIDPDYKDASGMQGHGYELIEDLLLNAQRRESQSRYDDAVGRIYRALELMIQLYLKKEYEILTGDVDLSKLPDTVREKYEVFRVADSGPIQISLKRSYELLSDLSDQTLQPLYQSNANRIEGILSIRNYSLFAHGFKSISKEQYEKFWEVASGFLNHAIQAASSASTKKWESKQFPNGMP